MTRDSLDWNRLARYVAGESTPQEAAEMRRWLDEHPSDAEVVAKLKTATAGLAPSRDVNVEHALGRVKARARAAPRPSVWRVSGIAAAAVLLLAAGIFAWNRARRASPPPEATYQTAAGARDTIRLRDGSTVFLAPASRMVIEGRQAWLQGEAYFDVVHDARHPFSVRAGDVVIRDVGTRFAVHGLSGEPVRVVVTEGSVQVTRAADSITLGRGDVAVVRLDGGGITASRGAASDDDIAWLHGRLVFRDAPVTQVAADLRRWYGVQLRVTGGDTALLQRHFTGSFVNEPGDRVIDVIALALGARVQRRGDTAFLRSIAAPR